MTKLGIMQSRLSPIDTSHKYQYCPTEGNWWANEFSVAKELGFNAIEWIYDSNPLNPLNRKDGWKEIVQCSKDFNIQVDAICADDFIGAPLWLETLAWTNTQVLIELIESAYKIGAKAIVLPCLDHSRFPSYDAQVTFKKVIQTCLETAEKYTVDLCLESNLKPAEVGVMLKDLDHPRFGVCYDTGNSASMGFSLAEEFLTYGNKIKHVHLKDCALGGRNTEIGTGAVNFRSVFQALDYAGYKGALTLQCARAITHNMGFIQKQKLRVESYVE